MGRSKKQLHGPVYTQANGVEAHTKEGQFPGCDPGKTKQAGTSWKHHKESVNARTKRKGK